MRAVFCCFSALLIAASAWAQSGTSAMYAQMFKRNSALGRSKIFVNVQDVGITNHVFEWTTQGGPTTCTLLIESSTDAVNWSTAWSQSCTSSGAVALPDATHIYLTVNLDALSGGTNPNVSVTYRGYLPGQGFPVRPQEGGTGTTTAFSAGSIPFAGPQGVYQQDNSRLFWDNTNKRLCILSNSCVNTLDVGGGKFFVTPDGAMSALGGSVSRAAGAGYVAHVIQGYTGQTASLAEWRTSTGTVLARTTASGIMSGNRLDNDVKLSGATRVDNTVTSVTATTPTALNSYQIPAGALAVGRTVRVTATGVYSTANASDTVTIAARVAGVDWHSITSTAASVTGAQWSLSWVFITHATGASGAAESQLPFAFVNGVFKQSPATATKTIDTTQARTIDLTAAWSDQPGGNTISIRQFIVEVLN